MKVQNANTGAPGGKPQFTGWCLDKDDLCVSKPCALREKDQNFVAALLDGGLVDAATLMERLSLLPGVHESAADRARSWLTTRVAD